MIDELKATYRALKADDRGQSASSSIQKAIVIPIALAVGALVAGIVMPIGLGELVNASTVNYSSGADTLWSNLDLFFILAVMGYAVAMMISTFRGN